MPDIDVSNAQVSVVPRTPAQQTADTNRNDFTTQADQAIDTLESAWTNWGALTAAQKDAALKLAVRVVTRLARLVLGRLV